MTPEERQDVMQAVAYHREKGGYTQHGQGCRCAGCRLVRTVEYLVEVEGAVNAMWAEVDLDAVRLLKQEHPEVVALASRLHDETYHGEDS